MPETQTDQTLFFDGLATYQKVYRQNLMSHREVYGRLRRVIDEDVRKPFTFLDIACGDAAGSADILESSGIGRYTGIDISQPSLTQAAQALRSLECPVELRCQDFVDALRDWTEPVDVVWLGMSLHHLQTQDKCRFFGDIARILRKGGVFLLWEPTLKELEDRKGWLDRFSALRHSHFFPLTDMEFQPFMEHSIASDFPETIVQWTSMGKEAGFAQADVLCTMKNGLGHLFRFQR